MMAANAHHKIGLISRDAWPEGAEAEGEAVGGGEGEVGGAEGVPDVMATS